MILTPKDKGGASPLLLVVGTFFLAVAVFILVVPVLKGEFWIYFIVGPFALLVGWLAKVFLQSWTNATFATTQVEISEMAIFIQNTPLGVRATIPMEHLRQAMIMDIGSPKLCLELLLVDSRHRTYQVCAFRRATPPILQMVEALEAVCAKATDARKQRQLG